MSAAETPALWWRLGPCQAAGLLPKPPLVLLADTGERSTIVEVNALVVEPLERIRGLVCGSKLEYKEFVVQTGELFTEFRHHLLGFTLSQRVAEGSMTL